jgi:hypothetical protein
MGPEEILDAADALVEDQGLAARRPHAHGLGERHAGLLEIVIGIAHAEEEPQRRIDLPGAVRVGEQQDLRGYRRAHGTHALHILERIGAHLDLDAGIAFPHIFPGALGHGVGTVLRHRSVELHALAEPAAREFRQRQPCSLAGQIPACHVDRRFEPSLPHHDIVQDGVDTVQLARIGAEQCRQKLGHSGANAGGEGFGIEGAERRHLAPPDQARVSFQPDNGGVETLLRVAAASVGTIGEGLELAISRRSRDLHGGSPIGAASRCRASNGRNSAGAAAARPPCLPLGSGQYTGCAGCAMSLRRSAPDGARSGAREGAVNVHCKGRITAFAHGRRGRSRGRCPARL